MKRFVIALATLVLTAQPADSAGMARQLSDQMRSVGVYISVKNLCPIRDAVASYDSETNVLCIAASRVRSKAFLTETVTHEAVHVIQDCLGGGLLSPNTSTIGEYLIKKGMNPQTVAEQFKLLNRSSISHTRSILRKSSEHTGVREFEAYSLEGSPHRVLSLLRNAC